MKIHPEHIEGVRQDRQDRAGKTRVKAPEESFGDLLDKELSKTSARPAVAAANARPIQPLLKTEALAGVQSGTNEAVAERVDGLLDKWQAYADGLRSGTGLREAYGLLEDISGGLKGLKDDWPSLAESEPRLQELVDELDILSVTERMKFNRGDYI
ncbi:MAG: hypothetical protein PHV85_00630 [Desulfovibrionaceae bacterium]|nr:hypothetical protein [Desulfovibrionaceae bacterium]